MSPVTEFAFVPLRPDSDIDDPNTSEGSIMATMLEKGKVAPGVQRNYWGKLIENQKEIYLLLDWDSLEDHKIYQARPDYGPFAAAAYSMVDPTRKPTSCHIAFQPHPPAKALLAPVAEVFIAYFPVADSQGSNFAQQFSKFIQALVDGKVVGLTGEFTGGWSVEEVDYKGELVKLFVGVVGWESIEAHLKAKKSEVYRENVAAVGERAPKGTHLPASISVHSEPVDQT